MAIASGVNTLVQIGDEDVWEFQFTRTNRTATYSYTKSQLLAARAVEMARLNVFGAQYGLAVAQEDEAAANQASARIVTQQRKLQDFNQMLAIIEEEG